MKDLLFILLLLSNSIYSQLKECGVLYDIPGKESAYPRLSKNGKEILYQSNQSGKWQLKIMDLDKNVHQSIISDTAHNNNFPDWNFDNTWVAFVSDKSGNEDIYIIRRDGSELKQITDDKARDIHPYFSPDGKYILFNSTRGNGTLDIYRYEIATGKTLRLTDTPDDETCARYSPDMKLIVYLRNGISFDDVFVMKTSDFIGENITKTFRTRDGWPMFSPDNKWIYYSSFETGIYHIYRMKPDGSAKQQLTTAESGEEDARVYISGDNKTLVYNKRIGSTIQIIKCKIS